MTVDSVSTGLHRVDPRMGGAPRPLMSSYPPEPPRVRDSCRLTFEVHDSPMLGRTWGCPYEVTELQATCISSA